jgi:hypothetical protein
MKCQTGLFKLLNYLHSLHFCLALSYCFRDFVEEQLLVDVGALVVGVIRFVILVC